MHSEGELRVWYYLWLLDLPVKPQKSFDGLFGVGGNLLRYDFYVSGPVPFLIEYNGVQHYYPSAFLADDEHGLLHMENFHRKVMYAYQQGIYLLQIPMGLTVAVEWGMVVNTVELVRQVSEQRRMAQEDTWLFGRVRSMRDIPLSVSKRKALKEIRSEGVSVSSELEQLEDMRRKKQRVDEDLEKAEEHYGRNVELLNRLRERIRIQNVLLAEKQERKEETLEITL